MNVDISVEDAIVKFLFAGLVLILIGCSQSSEKEPEAMTPDIQKTTKKTINNVASGADMAIVKEPEEPKKARKKLDLSIPLESADNYSVESATTEMALLPDMFSKSEARTKLRGGLIRDVDNEDYMDSIEGAKIDIEIKH